MFKILLCAFLACAGVLAVEDPKTTTGSPDLPSTATPVTPDVNPVNPHTGIVEFEFINPKNKSVVCALGSFGGSINFDLGNSTTVQNTTVANSFALDQTVRLDSNLSSCTENRTTLFFTVHKANDSVSAFTLQLSHESGSYKLDKIEVTYSYINGTNKLGPKWDNIDLQLSKDENTFTAPDDKSYECLSKQTMKLVNITQSDHQTGTISFENFKLDAFRHDNSTVARTKIKCWLDNKSRDFVPLAVAIALIILIVIVLVAYLIGRKRSRRLAYESV